jgi:hypothetical protein
MKADVPNNVEYCHAGRRSVELGDSCVHGSSLFHKESIYMNTKEGKLRKSKLVIASILTQLIAEKIEIGFSNPNFTILNFKNYKENFNIF